MKPPTLPAQNDGIQPGSIRVRVRSSLFLILVVLLAAVATLGCGDDDPDPPRRSWVLVDTDSLTGFYVGKTDGGLVTIRLENYEYLTRRPPMTPPLEPPTEVFGTLYPDDADTVIHLVGNMYGTHGTTYFGMHSASAPIGGGYVFSGTYSGHTFGGFFAGPSDTGYFGGYAGSMDSVQVYCGSFAGDSLGGQWHFAVRAPLLRGAGVSSDTSVVLAFNGAVSGPGPTGSVTFDGTANGKLSLTGGGTLSPEIASGTWSLSGGFDSGSWTVERMRADSLATLRVRPDHMALRAGSRGGFSK